MRRRYALLTAVVASGLAPAAADATWQGEPGRVAYDTAAGLQTVRPDGSHRRLLVKGNTSYGLDWSRGGRELAFSTGGLWRMRADGSHKKLILSENGIATVFLRPAWSPGGQRLVFTAETEPTDPDDQSQSSTSVIYTVRRDGTHLRKVADGIEAVWSKSGRHIRFAEKDGDIAQVEPDGGAYKVLAHQDGYTHSLDLSPDGKRLVYETHPFETPDGKYKATVYVLEVRTGERSGFNGDRLGALDLLWTPSGRRLAFVHTPSGPGRSQFRTMRPDGRDIRSVFRFSARNSVPSDLAWQTR